MFERYVQIVHAVSGWGWEDMRCAMNGLRMINRILLTAVFGRRIFERLVAIGIAALFSTHSVGGAELKVVSANAMHAALQELAQHFEAASVHKAVIEYGTVGYVEKKVLGDDPVDVAINIRPLFEKLGGSGKLFGDIGAPLARVPMGLAVRASAPKPDIRTVAAWQKALLAANIVTYGDPRMGDAAGIHLAHVLETLGLAEVLRSKTRLISPSAGQSGAQYLAGLFQRGETEIAMAPISVLGETQGVDIVGLLPAELQSPDLSYWAGLVSTSRHAAEAMALIGFLTSPPARAVYRAKSMEPG